jgi:hypothetical protein
MKQTSIEWLWEEIDNLVPYQDINSAQQFYGLLEKAKEMHKQEIVDAWIEGESSVYITTGEIYTDGDAEQYYQETFVSNGSDTLKDYHIVDTNEMVQLSQEEISDEEIENYADDHTTTLEMYVGFIAGVKWYREKLKNADKKS